VNDTSLEGFAAPEDVLGVVGEDAQAGHGTLTFPIQACLKFGSR